MKKLVKVGLVVPMMLLVAFAISGLVVAEEPETAELNQDLNRTLNGDGRDDARSVEVDASETEVEGDSTVLRESSRDLGRDLNSSDRTDTSDRTVRRGRQAPRGQTSLGTAADERSGDSRSGKSGDEGGDEDEDVSPSMPGPLS